MAPFFLKLPFAATAVPIQALSSPNPSAPTPAGTASGVKCLSHSGVIPPTSLRVGSGLDAEHPAGARRPFPVPN